MSLDVVISGIGVVSPLGNNLDAFWNAMLYRFEKPIQVGNGICFKVKDWDESRKAGLSLVNTWTIEATKQALHDANLEESYYCNKRIAVVIGNNAGESEALERELDQTEPMEREVLFLNNTSAEVSRHFGFTGSNKTISTACSAGLYSVATGYELIRDGLADIVVVGGSDKAGVVNQSCFERIGATDPVTCRPFDTKRRGTVVGEGAAILIIESSEHAKKRGHKKNYAQIKGYGYSCDGYHVTGPEPSGLYASIAIERALSESNLNTEDISVIIPHGTGTILNDIAESRAIQRVFGKEKKIIGSAIKSKLGHSIGGAGSFSCVVASLILKYSSCPPTANLEEKEADCPLLLHTEGPLEGNYSNILINSYAFGGNNASLILGV